MKHIAIIFILLCLAGCKHSNPYKDTTIELVEVKSFPLEKISVRAMVLLEKNVAFAGSDATFGFINTQNQTIATSNLKNRRVISDFRAVAATSQNFFMLSIGNPALLYKAEQSGMEEVYREEHPDVFYDVLRFTDDQFGIAIGDPIDNRLSVVTTLNGGQQWTKLTWSQSPKLEEGESVFAASNSALAHYGNKLWVVTGGSKSRVLFSDNKGYKWQDLATLPLAQGSPTQGAFTIAFYNDQQGIVLGGDYEQPTERKGSGALTFDGGKTWQPIATDKAIGYASCVQYIPDSEGNALVATSPNGLFFSNDQGKSWQQLSDKSYHALLFVDEQTMVASGNEKITLFRVVKK